MLLASSADIHAKGIKGDTALHYAADSGYVYKVNVMLAAGANTTTLND